MNRRCDHGTDEKPLRLDSRVASQALMEGKSPEMTNGEYLTKILTTYLDQPATAKQEQRTLPFRSQMTCSAAEVLPGCSCAPHPKGTGSEPFESGTGSVGTWRGTAPECGPQDNKKERTLAIAMPESLFHRVEQYVEAHNGVSNESSLWGWWHRNSNLG